MPTKDKNVRMTESLQLQGATWTNEMRQHFTRTGTYRTADVNRLLGDPGSSATVQGSARIRIRGKVDWLSSALSSCATPHIRCDGVGAFGNRNGLGGVCCDDG